MTTPFPLITIGLDLAPHIALAALRAALAGIFLIALGILCGRSMPVGYRSWGLIAVVELGGIASTIYARFDD